MATPPTSASPLDSQLVSRMRGFGTTIFTQMSALANQTGAINLGQGFPDEDGPESVLDVAVDASGSQPLGRARARMSSPLTAARPSDSSTSPAR